MPNESPNIPIGQPASSGGVNQTRKLGRRMWESGSKRQRCCISGASW